MHRVESVMDAEKLIQIKKRADTHNISEAKIITKETGNQTIASKKKKRTVSAFQSPQRLVPGGRKDLLPRRDINLAQFFSHFFSFRGRIYIGRTCSVVTATCD